MNIIQYQESFGPINWQDGFEKELVGRSIEEQMRCYALTEFSFLRSVPYAELENNIRERNFLKEIHAVHDFWSAIVRDGIVVGVAYKQYDVFDNIVKDVPLLPYRGYVYDSTDDNNGSGYKERDWYKYLVCLPHNHTLW